MDCPEGSGHLTPGHGAVRRDEERTTPSRATTLSAAILPNHANPPTTVAQPANATKAEFPVLVALIESGHRTQSRAGGSGARELLMGIRSKTAS